MQGSSDAGNRARLGGISIRANAVEKDTRKRAGRRNSGALATVRRTERRARHGNALEDSARCRELLADSVHDWLVQWVGGNGLFMDARTRSLQRSSLPEACGEGRKERV